MATNNLFGFSIGSIGGSGQLQAPQMQLPGGVIKKPSPTGQVLGVSTSKTTSNNSSSLAPVTVGNFTSLLNNVKSSGVLQKASNKGPSLKSIQDAYAPVISGFQNQASTLQGQLPTTLSDLEGQAQVSKNSLLGQQGTQQATLNQDRTAAQQSTDQSVAEQQRAFNEVQRGLQAQYGGTTGTGQFAAELAGRQTIGNIGQLRQGYQVAISKIADAENALNNDVKDKLFNLDQTLNQAKNEARNNLANKISEINNSIALTKTDIANKKLDAINTYKAQQANIEAQNQQFIQGLYVDYQTKFGALKTATDQTNQNFTQALQNAQNNGTVSTPGTNPPTQAPDSAQGVLQVNPSGNMGTSQQDPLGVMPTIQGDNSNLFQTTTDNTLPVGNIGL